MPIVELHLVEGYGSAEKQRLGEALTDAVRSVVPETSELVTVIIHDMPAENYHRGRTTHVPSPARADPAELARAYLAAMEARDIATAEAMLGDGFVMQFPGAAPMSKLQELTDWATPRYRFVKKTYEGCDAMQSSGDAAIVYCRGALSGEWPNGTAFGRIRFIDRFEITDGRITRQDVWNDIAEAKASHERD